MSIYIDISAAVHKRAGLGRYAESLARALAQLVPGRLELFYNRERGVKALKGLEQLPAHTVALDYKPWRMIVWAAHLCRVGFDWMVPGATVFHATEHLLLPLHRVPTVLTVHDLIFRHLPEHHKPLNRWYLNWSLPLYCRRASHIIAVSEHTRQEIINAYGLPAQKITVIPEAAGPNFEPASPDVIAAVRHKYHLPDRFLLTVSTLEPRKNLARLLEAWGPLHSAGAAPPLVIAGKPGWLNSAFMQALERSPQRAGVILTGYVAEADLPALYGAAEAFVFPSEYEGFGLPPLEAMACGVPVACSNSSSLPEVVGDAALLFAPREVGAIRAALEQIISQPGLRAELRERGLAMARQFTWAATAERTLAVYEMTLNRS
jgi:glycosyltransferase involved in cell wall biosynthesis